MSLEIFTYPVPFCIVKNFLTSEKLQKVKTELNELTPYLQPPEFTGAARGNDNQISVKRKGIFLHEHPYLRGNSGINSIFDNVKDPLFLSHLTSLNWIFGYLTNPSSSGTLVSLYTDGDEYKYHSDRSVMSIIYYLFDGEFEGGDFFLKHVKVPIENNSLIIFPSCVEHAVTPIKGPGKRWAITNFFNIKSDIPKIPNENIYRFTNFLSPEEWRMVQDIVNNGMWTYTGQSDPRKPNSCKFMYMDLSNNKFLSEDVFKRIPHGPWEIDRLYANGQTTGLNGDFHKDSERQTAWTFMIYASEIDPNFIENWGGATEFETEHGRYSQVPEPNLGILFKSDILHRGLAPSRYVNGMRVTITWKLHKA